MSEFLSYYELWIDPLLILVISSIVLSYIGVWSVFQKGYYIPLTLSSINSFGVIVAFWFGEIYNFSGNIYIFPLVFGILSALYFSNPRVGGAKGEVSAYIISSALFLIVGSFVRQDLHDVQSILFGTTVLAERKELYTFLVVSLVVLSFFYFFHKKFIFVVFDSQGAAAAGISPQKHRFILYALFALTISVAGKSIGSLPVFGLTIVPALTATIIGKSFKTIAFISILSAFLSVIIGYYISFILELPTGATIVSINSIFYILANIKSKFINN
ncbi:metal ABC transporter permease [bacterium]|nr:metal ABC transporter permease [bacterium]